MVPVWPVHCPVHAPVLKFQLRRYRSRDPLTSQSPSNCRHRTDSGVCKKRSIYHKWNKLVSESVASHNYGIRPFYYKYDTRWGTFTVVLLQNLQNDLTFITAARIKNTYHVCTN